MQFNRLKSTLKSAVQALAVLLLGAGWAAGQQQVNLTAGPTSITLPDGSSVPMWGYSCGDACGRFNRDLRQAESRGRAAGRR